MSTRNLSKPHLPITNSYRLFQVYLCLFEKCEHDDATEVCPRLRIKKIIHILNFAHDNNTFGQVVEYFHMNKKNQKRFPYHQRQLTLLGGTTEHYAKTSSTTVEHYANTSLGSSNYATNS